jgi:hypothetical protein
VFLAGGHRLTARACIRAAGLWAGERAVVSGPTAACWHRMLATAPAEIEVTVPRRSGLRAYAGHKGNTLVRSGWDLLRFTWHDLRNRPDYVVGEIRAARLAASARP